MKLGLLSLPLIGLALHLTIACAEEKSHYFPETGRAAIHQRSLDLGNNGVVLAVVLQPGYEDFPLLAYLRTAVGVRVGIAYVTNGEATAGELGEKDPAVTAGERKEEAHAAMKLLDVTERFLNLPDPGVVGSEQELENIWGRDTTLARLRRILQYYRPDVVLIGGDLRTDTVQSLRQRLVTQLVQEAIKSGADAAAKSQGNSSLPSARGPMVFGEVQKKPGGGREPLYDKIHQVWKKSHRSIGAEAAEKYRSLRLQIGFYSRMGDRRYAALSSRGSGDPLKVIAGLPSVGPELRRLTAEIRKLCAPVKRVRAPRLSNVIQTIDSVDRVLARGRQNVGDKDARVLAGWKDGLENIRCSLLDVKVSYAATESLIAVNQLFYLKFNGLSSKSSLSGTKIFFPLALNHVWGINESVSYQFPFQPTDKFEILTPQNLDYVYPPGQFGVTQSALRTRFPFILIHNDSLPGLSYLYRGDVLLRPAPKRSFEILTPIVRAVEGQSIISRLTNTSRDPFEGEISLEDTLVHAVHKKILLKGKDTVLLDTLVLALRSMLPPGDYPLSVSLPGAIKGSFTLRSFPALVDPRSRVALLGPSAESPVGQALDRLNIPWQFVDPLSIGDSAFTGFTAAVLDRNTLAQLQNQDHRIEALLSWVRLGGSLIVLPQGEVVDGGEGFMHGLRYRRSPEFSTGTKVRCDTASSVFRFPNILTPEDWDGWVVARSLCSVQIAPARNARTLVSAGDPGVSLMAQTPEGKGQICLVALDLTSQLINVNPGAHRLLANLLATRQ